MTWSPDGTQFAFTSAITANDYEIFRINADGTGETQLTFAGRQPSPRLVPGRHQDRLLVRRARQALG